MTKVPVPKFCKHLRVTRVAGVRGLDKCRGCGSLLEDGRAIEGQDKVEKDRESIRRAFEIREANKDIYN